MFYQKLALAITLSSSFLAFSPSSSAKSAFTEKYAPYIGYQHGYSYAWKEKINAKYAPRFFVGISPIQGDNYKMGIEIGYTLPKTYRYEDGYYSYFDKDFKLEKYSRNIKSSDLYLTYYRRLTQNSHWFLKPGLEHYYISYQNHSYANGKAKYNWSSHHNSIYLGTKAGAGYNFNKKLGINAVVGSRFYDFARNDSYPFKLTFNINAEYAF